jgi:hypothetical protein
MTNDASHPGRPEPRRASHRRRAGPLAAGLTTARIAAGLLAAGLLAAACGGPAGPGVANAGPTSSASPSTSASGSALAYSRCMRAHGITKFPDPDSHGDLGLNAGPGSGIDPNSPQFKAADRACKHLMPAPNAGQAAKDRPALLRYARCMRAHGIPDFPDPEPGGGFSIKASRGSDLDPNNPIYKAADRACTHYMPGGGHGGSTQNSGGGGGS